jgi:phage repressor protein C with HTH and peptisase S24 domain
MSQNTTTVLNKVNTKVVCFFNTAVLNSQAMKLIYGDRLRAARIHKGYTQTRLEEKSGVKQGTISKIERGEQDSSSFDIPLAMALDVNPAWLKDGDEQYAPDWLTGKSVNEKNEGYTASKLRHIPVVGKSQLGDNGFWCDMDYPAGHGDGYILFPSVDEDAYALRCVGDSMRPRVKNGEFVVIEPNTLAQPGDEVLVKAHDGRVMVKTFLYERDGLCYFQSINESHPSFSIAKKDIDSIHYIAAIIKSSRWIKY